eukprot:CAMPEP_0196655022 /NCGR_PEP_ID=MMETSP1086-20130531/4779_1 /TAXON_ID=77921 /ORGANISM="Cyanoptyche  gloeocystis , Strain SAG4.97" /LENGTH=183 /DNA_ID=CAMNT_0041987113 /DNA_START=705 /DNA_END=1257 /DNA_ORIENTATION=+
MDSCGNLTAADGGPAEHEGNLPSNGEEVRTGSSSAGFFGSEVRVVDVLGHVGEGGEDGDGKDEQQHAHGGARLVRDAHLVDAGPLGLSLHEEHEDGVVQYGRVVAEERQEAQQDEPEARDTRCRLAAVERLHDPRAVESPDREEVQGGDGEAGPADDDEGVDGHVGPQQRVPEQKPTDAAHQR